MLALSFIGRIFQNPKSKERLGVGVDPVTQSTVNNVNSILSLNVREDLLKLFTKWLELKEYEDFGSKVEIFNKLLFSETLDYNVIFDLSNIHNFILELDDYLDGIEELEDGMNLKQDITSLFNDDLTDIKRKAYIEAIPIIKKELAKIHGMF